MNFILGSDWNFKTNLSFTVAENSREFLGSFNSSFVAVKITSSLASSTRKKAGKVCQGINLNPNTVSFANYQDVYLNVFTLLYFPYSSPSDLLLYYFGQSSLGEVNIEVWEYSGTLSDRLQTIENKINNLMGLYTENIPVTGQVELGTPISFQQNIVVPAERKQLFMANAERKGLILKNLSETSTIYFHTDIQVSFDTYIFIIPPGYSYSFDALYTGELWVQPTGETLLKVVEFGCNSLSS